MELNDWILALHLLAAFAIVGAEVIFGAMIVTLWRETAPCASTRSSAVSRIATVMVLAGTVGTLVFGVWLSLSKDPYDLWDGWIIAALVLWAIAAAGGTGGGQALRQRRHGGRRSSPRPGRRHERRASRETFGPSRAFRLHVVSNVAILAAPRRHDLEAGRMIGLLADIRPDSWNFPLFLHVARRDGARRRGDRSRRARSLTPGGGGDPAGLRRFAFRTLLFVGLPAYIVMRIGAEWIYAKEFGDLPDDDPAWIGIGYITADLGAAPLPDRARLRRASRRAKSKRPASARRRRSSARSLLVGWLVAVWAMGAKPS